MTLEPRITALPNGLRVVSQNMPHLESAAIGVWVDIGARHEAAQLHGISHLLEHMAFKGTRRRNAQQIAETIEAVGGHLNAYTSRENTAYFIRVLKNDIPLAVDILSDILQESVFDPNELDRELDVIVQEIGQSLDTPDDLVFDRLQEVSAPVEGALPVAGLLLGLGLPEGRWITAALSIMLLLSVITIYNRARLALRESRS